MAWTGRKGAWPFRVEAVEAAFAVYSAELDATVTTLLETLIEEVEE